MVVFVIVVARQRAAEPRQTYEQEKVFGLDHRLVPLSRAYLEPLLLEAPHQADLASSYYES